MNEPLLLLVAVAAGFVSFSSPCSIPLVPGYLSYVSALPVADLDDRHARRLLLRSALLFVAGFGLIFALLGMTSGLLGSYLVDKLPVIVKISGFGIIFLGLANLRIVPNPLLLLGDRRPGLKHVGQGPRWAFPFGMAFAAGWTPCIGPVLATILTTAATTQTALWGGALLLAYSFGLGLPFVAITLGFGRAQRSLGFVSRHLTAIERVGGIMLVLIGVGFVTGTWMSIFRPMQRWFADFGWPPV